MIIRLCLMTALFFAGLNGAQAADSRVATIKSEFERLYSYVQKLKPDGIIGETAKYKKVGPYLVIWEIDYNVDQDDIIRLYHEHKDGTESFDVSYYRTTGIVEGRTVLRRSVGPTIIGWRNDTIDLDSGEYMGRQGREVPVMNSNDQKMLQHFKIRLFK